MRFFGHISGKSLPAETYDRVNTVPVIRASICNGEKVAGFRDIHSGHFSEIMVIRGDRDLEDFMHRYGIDDASAIHREW